MVISSLGSNHADEILLSPETNAQDVFPMITGNGAMPQPVIELPTNDLTRRALDALSLPNSLDEDGDPFAVIPGGGNRSDLHCFFIWHLTIVILVLPLLQLLSHPPYG